MSRINNIVVTALVMGALLFAGNAFAEGAPASASATATAPAPAPDAPSKGEGAPAKRERTRNRTRKAQGRTRKARTVKADTEATNTEDADTFDWRKAPRVSVSKAERVMLKEVRAQVVAIRDSKKGIVRTDLSRIVRYCDRVLKGQRA